MKLNDKKFGKSSAKFLPNRTEPAKISRTPNRTEPKFRSLPNTDTVVHTNYVIIRQLARFYSYDYDLRKTNYIFK